MRLLIDYVGKTLQVYSEVDLMNEELEKTCRELAQLSIEYARKTGWLLIGVPAFPLPVSYFPSLETALKQEDTAEIEDLAREFWKITEESNRSIDAANVTIFQEICDFLKQKGLLPKYLGANKDE